MSAFRFLAWPWRIYVWGMAGADDPWARRNLSTGRHNEAAMWAYEMQKRGRS